MRKIILSVLALSITTTNAADKCTADDVKIMEQEAQETQILACIGQTLSKLPECYGGSKLSSGCVSCLTSVLDTDNCKNVVCNADNIESCMQCLASTVACSPDSPATTTKSATTLTLLAGVLVSIAVSLF
jgi:hypothetical protein